MRKQIYPYFWRCPKAPTENYIFTLENKNNIQDQTFSKLRKGNIEIMLSTTRSQSRYSRLQSGVLEHKNDSTGSGVNKPDYRYQVNADLHYQYRGRS